MELLGHLCGYIATFGAIFLFLSTKRDRILLCKITTDILWILNMLFLGLYTGFLLNVIHVTSSIVFYYRDKKKWASSPVWCFVFLAAILISPVFSWAGWISLIPTLGSFISTIGYYSKSAKLMRFAAFPAQGLWLTYACIEHNTSSMICNIFLLLSAIIGTIRHFSIDRKEGKTYIKKAE